MYRLTANLKALKNKLQESGAGRLSLTLLTIRLKALSEVTAPHIIEKGINKRKLFLGHS